MSHRVYLYVTGVWIAAFAAICSLATYGPSIPAAALQGALWFAGLAVLGQALTFGRSQRGIQGTVSSLPVLTAVIVAPDWRVVCLLGAASLVGEIVVRREPIKQAFNVALSVLSASAAATAYAAVLPGGGFPFEESNLPRVLLGFAAASFSHSIVTSGLLAGVLRVSQGTRVRPTWNGIIRETVASDVLAVPFMYVFARVYVALGGLGALVLSIPLIGMRQLYVANFQLKKMNEELLELMVAAIEARDPYTSGHSRRVAQYSRIIAETLRLSPKKIDEVAKAALMHDVGKIDEKYAPLLRKPTRLTAEEEAVMQTHAARSAELVAKVSSLSSLVAPVRHHHEAWDGTGYPDGLAGERIPLASRIIAFADTIDAMTSERPYRAGLSAEIVRAELMRCRGTQFDPTITDHVVSAETWKSLFPDSDAPQAESRPLKLVPAPARRFG